jgi:hypothetical protein
MELPVSMPLFVVTNDVNNSGDGGRVVLHGSPAFYRSRGFIELATNMEALGLTQLEVVAVFARDEDMLQFPFLKAETETMGFVATIATGEVITPPPLPSLLLPEPPVNEPE